MDTVSVTVPDAGDRETSPEVSHLGRYKFLAAAALVVLGVSTAFWAITEWASIGEKGLARPCLPFAAGIGMVLCGSLLNTSWFRLSLWSAIALVGQAATLQLIDAGRRIHFQHYRTIPELLTTEVLPLTLFAVQATIVLFVAAPRWKEVRIWVAEAIGWTRFITLIGFLGLAGAAVTPDVEIYLTSLLIAGVVTLANLLNVYLIASSVPEHSNDQVQAWLRKFLSESGDRIVAPAGLDRFAATVSLSVVVLSGLLSYFVYQAHPHIPDEAQYVFQAKYMAAGQLSVSPPAVPEAFSMYMVPYLEDHWYSIFPPAFPVVLSLGVLAGAVWLVNPLLAGLCILLAHKFFQDLYSRPFARVAVILLACSPWFIFMGMSLMSHMLTLACSLAGAVLLQQSFRRRSITLSLAAGMAAGIVSLIRPLDGLIVTGMLAAWGLWGTGTIASGWLTGAATAVGAVITGAANFAYNKAVTGMWTALPLETYYNKYFWPGASSLGFGQNRGLGWELDAFPGHSPMEAVINTALNVFQLNTELFGWAAGSLAVVGFFIVSGAFTKKDIWALVCIIGVIGAYAFHWYHGGPDLGARYWFICIIPLVALTVRGLEVLSAKRATSRSFDSLISFRLAATVAVLCVITVSSYIPWRAADKYYRYLDAQPGIEALANKTNFGKSLVLVRGSEHPDYQSAWVYNPPNFEGDGPIYARDNGPEIRRRLAQAYPDRVIWIVDGPTISGAGYAIREGPMNGEALVKQDEMTSR